MTERQTRDSLWLAAAVELTHELWKRSNGDARACRWTGDELYGDHPQRMQVVHADLGPGLYAGNAGIGYFVAVLGQTIGDSRLVRAGVSALLGAVRECQEDLSPDRLSLYSGAAGVALKAVELASLLRHDELLGRGLQLARCCAQRLSETPPEESDLLAGVAGGIVALCAIHRDYPADEIAHAVRVESEQLCIRRCRGLLGCSWRSVAEPTSHGLCGLGHGASGIAWALLDAADLLQAASFAEVAMESLAYERSWFDASQSNWADLRNADAPGGTVAWCHGAIGIGALRLQLYERGADPGFLAEASAAILAARRVAAAARHGLEQNEAPDTTLCHGLGGVIELLLLAYEVTRQPEHARAAQRVGQLGLEIYARNHRRWPIGLPGATHVPGLMTGLAGIGTWLLRLHDIAAVGSPLLAGRPAIQERVHGPVVTSASSSA